MGRAGAALAGGGGVAAGPITLDQFLYVSSVSPATAVSTPHLINGATAVEAPGGLPAASHNTVIGNGAAVTSATQDSVVIGYGCTAGIGGTPNNVVVIGKALVHTGGQTGVLIGGPYPASAHADSVMIGGSNGGTKGGSSFVAIGYAMNMNAGLAGVQIGTGSTTHGGTTVVIGNAAGGGASQVVIGHATTTLAGSSHAVVIGAGIALSGAGAGTGVICLGTAAGGTIAGLTNAICIGHGSDPTGLGAGAAGWMLLGNNSYGGTGFTSNYLFGGADLHTNLTAVPATTVRFKNAQGTDIAAGGVTFIAPLATGSAASGSFAFKTGVAAASSATVQSQSSVMKLTSTQKVEISNDRGLSFPVAVSGGGGAAGTLGNAPAAGDPTHWLKILIGGVNFCIPCWPG